MNSIFIIGLGLIGGSIGLKLNGKWKRFGFDINEETNTKAIKYGVVDEIVELDDGFKKDIILISIPVQDIPNFIKDNREKFNKNSIVIDTGSTKRSILDEMKKLNSFYIGGHPIAGKEKGGIDNVDKDLFKNRIFILTEENNLNEEKMDLVKKFIFDIESIPLFLDSKKHDYIFGLVSHLPYVLSIILFDYIFKKGGFEIFKYAGPGLKDTTRIASGDPYMSFGFVKTNCDNLKLFLREIIEEFITISDKLDKEDFFEKIKNVKEVRDKIW
ncbi:MAG: prephenate dehydrogenase [Caldisericia bacterium]|nr:prephenate dehydrogenase [Caldisericia bacterium]